LKFSIIIINYNYGRFVGQAIESALAIDWPDKEIIVVDDGSLDDSRNVISSFGDRITAIFKANGGQTSAANAGFGRSTGDAVIFLDADDMLLPSVAQQVISVWKRGIAKVQYGLIPVDERLKPLGRCSPIYTERNTPEWAARSMRETGTYLSSPTSGNAWSRDFLSEVFPLPTRDTDCLSHYDVFLARLAPFFGDVVSLTTNQFLYRWHGSNDSLSGSLYKYINRLNHENIVHKLAVAQLQKKTRASSLSFENEHYAMLSLIVRRFFPSHYQAPIAGVLLRYWRAVCRGEFSSRKKFFLVFWSLVVVASPRPLAQWVTMNREGHYVVGRPGSIVKGIVTILRRVAA
jgi:glycosyltransferase involved in cell wall biosynthesis